jgi:hypothetical protein
MTAKIETNTYTTPAPPLCDPQAIQTVEEAHKVVAVYNTLVQDYHRSLVHREEVINSMAAETSKIVLARMNRDDVALAAAVDELIRKHVQVIDVASQAKH